MNDIGFVVAVKSISKILNDMWAFCTSAWNVISNPVDNIVIPAIDMSYWVLLITAMVCLILTIAGCKKTKNVPLISTILFVIMQCLKSVLVGL